jgi:hypothetical protein
MARKTGRRSFPDEAAGMLYSLRLTEISAFGLRVSRAPNVRFLRLIALKALTAVQKIGNLG